MPYFYYFSAWVFIIFCQIVIAPRIALGDVYPDIVMVATILIGLKRGWKWGLWYGFAFGLTIDLINPQGNNWSTLLISFSGYFAGIVREKIFLDNILYQSVAVLIFTLIYYMAFQLINWPLYFIGNLGRIFTDSLLISVFSFGISILALFLLGQRSRLRELL